MIAGLEAVLKLCEQYKVSEIEFDTSGVGSESVKRIAFAETVTIGEPIVEPGADDGEEQGTPGYNKALERMTGEEQ